MKTPRSTHRSLLVLALLSGIIFAYLGIGLASEKLVWYRYKEGMLLGQTLQRKVVINFYADWCRFCKKMDRETFTDQKIKDYLISNFVTIKVDSDNETAIASHYEVAGLPSTWFVAENGEKISNLPGFISPDVFLNILRYIHTDSYRKMSFDAFVKGS